MGSQADHLSISISGLCCFFLLLVGGLGFVLFCFLTFKTFFFMVENNDSRFSFCF